MLRLHQFLKPLEFASEQNVFVTIDPATKFGIIGLKDGTIDRVEGVPHILVPMYDWAAERVDEDEVIVKVLCEAAQANPLKLGSTAVATHSLWTKFRPLRALLMNPSMQGKFLMPVGPAVLVHAAVPENQIVAMGPPEMVGIYAKQGYARNVVAHNKRGLTSIQFFTV